MEEISPEFKQALLDTIDQIEGGGYVQPVVFKWTFDEKPTWTIALGFKQDAQGVTIQ